MRIVAIIIFIFCFLESLNCQNSILELNYGDTIKNYNTFANLERLVYYNSDSTLTEIRFSNGDTIYLGTTIKIKNDTITKFKTFHCNGAVKVEGEWHSKLSFPIIKSNLTPKGKKNYLAYFDPIHGNGQVYSYNYYQCQLITVDIQSYKNGKLEGPSYTLSDLHGDTISILTYSNGILNGIVKRFINGYIYQKLNYKNGVIDGTVKYYNNEGKVMFNEKYNNGNIISDERHASVRYEILKVTEEICKKLLVENLSIRKDTLQFNELINDYFVSPPRNLVRTYNIFTRLKRQLENKKNEIAAFPHVKDPIQIDYSWSMNCSFMNKDIGVIDPANIILINYSFENYLDSVYFYFDEKGDRIISILPLFSDDKIICFEQ